MVSYYWRKFGPIKCLFQIKNFTLIYFTFLCVVPEFLAGCGVSQNSASTFSHFTARLTWPIYLHLFLTTHERTESRWIVTKPANNFHYICSGQLKIYFLNCFIFKFHHSYWMKIIFRIISFLKPGSCTFFFFFF